MPPGYLDPLGDIEILLRIDCYGFAPVNASLDLQIFWSLDKQFTLITILLKRATFEMLKLFFPFIVVLIVGSSALAETFGASANLHGPRVISPFGATESFRLEPHNATDYGIPIGTPILAPADGQVVYVRGLNDDAGNPVPVGNHFLIQHEQGYRTFYAHLEKIFVTPGQVVTRGDVIALSGNTGTSPDGKWKNIYPHLHFRLDNVNAKPIDPYPDYWYGNKGRPLAFDPSVVYPDSPFLLTHPVAYGKYLETARKISGVK